MKKIELTITDDTLLLQQLECGSKAAFNELFSRYWKKAYALAYRRLKNAEDAKDIVQEIFIQIWLNRDTILIDNFPAYLYAAVRNKVIKLISKQKQIHPLCEVLINMLHNDSQTDGDLLWKELQNSYEMLLNSLPPKRQAIFRLRYQENLSTKDISIKLGITRKTVQNQLARAIESVKIS